VHLGEIDDGVFDWMIILDQKRKQKELLKEAEKLARERDNLEKPHNTQDISDLAEKQVQSPIVSTAGVVGSPLNGTMDDNHHAVANTIGANTSPAPNARNDAVAVTNDNPTGDPSKAPRRKKVGWFKRLFCCARDYLQ
jgi:hypothetical protein